MFSLANSISKSTEMSSLNKENKMQKKCSEKNALYTYGKSLEMAFRIHKILASLKLTVRGVVFYAQTCLLIQVFQQ